MTNPNDAGRWPVYGLTRYPSATVDSLTRNCVEMNTKFGDDRSQIVSDFTALAAENRRLREAMEKAIVVLNENCGDHIPHVGIGFLQDALAEPTP